CRRHPHHYDHRRLRAHRRGRRPPGRPCATWDGPRRRWEPPGGPVRAGRAADSVFRPGHRRPGYSRAQAAHRACAAGTRRGRGRDSPSCCGTRGRWTCCIMTKGVTEMITPTDRVVALYVAMLAGHVAHVFEETWGGFWLIKVHGGLGRFLLVNWVLFCIPLA